MRGVSAPAAGKLRYGCGMEPIFGMLLYLVLVAIVWIVASKRGRPGWVFALGGGVLGVALAMFTARVGGSAVAAGWAAFAGPAAGLLMVLAGRTGDAIAAAEGSYRGRRRCPHCAESIKTEAQVCKHCGRDVPAP